MHVAVLTSGGLPNPISGGGALTAYTVLRHLLDTGHDVTAFAVHDPHYFDPTGASVDARAAHLEGLGARVVPIVSSSAAVVGAKDLRTRVRRVVAPGLGDLLPNAVDAPALREAVAASGCEVAFAYHWEPLAASRGLGIPRVAGVGDPAHLPKLYRWRDRLPSGYAIRSSLQLQALVRRLPRAMATLLEECAEYGAFAAHHAEWLRAHGAPRCRYLRTPVPDEAGPGWAEAREPRAPGEPPHFLLLGHLAGIVTIDGLRVVQRMLPALDGLLGRDGYVVDVVGGYDPPGDLRTLFGHPAVRRHGHTDDPASWLRRADALLVPTSIPLGIRVRIVTGLCYGTPIVSHRANALGIPELEHGRNALLGSSPEALAAELARLAGDEGLRTTLGREARATYERWFAPPVAAGAIVELLEAAVRR